MHQESTPAKKNAEEQEGIKKEKSAEELYAEAQDCFEKTFYEDAIGLCERSIEVANAIIEKARECIVRAKRKNYQAEANKKVWEANNSLKDGNDEEALKLYLDAEEALKLYTETEDPMNLEIDCDTLNRINNSIKKAKIIFDTEKEENSERAEETQYRKEFYYKTGKSFKFENWIPTQQLYNHNRIPQYLKELNESQYIAATASRNKNICVSAGAGTGKTKTIVSRIAYLLTQGVHPDRIHVFTFSKKAAKELRERISKVIGNVDISTKTFHSWCYSILYKNASKFNFIRAKNSLLSNGDDKKLFSIVINEENIKIFTDDTDENKQINYTSPMSITDVVSCYSYLKESEETLEYCLQRFFPYILSFNDKEKKLIIDSLKLIFEKYEAKKQKLIKYDFVDLLCIVINKLCEDEFICKQICSQYDYILIDEMQDISFLQWKLLSAFAKYAKLFCVGDVAQAIYGFRGGDFKYMQDFNFQPAIKLQLEENYRSTQEILDLSNWLLNESNTIKYDKKIHSMRGKGKIPALHTFYNEEAESKWIIGDILKRTLKGNKANEYCIIVRSTVSSRPIEHILLENDLSYEIIGGKGLLASAHIADVISVLRIIYDNSDEIAWLTYLRLYGVPDSEKHCREFAKISFKESCNLLSSYNQKAANLLQIAYSKRSNLNEMFRTVIKMLFGKLKRKYERIYSLSCIGLTWKQRLDDLNYLEKLASKYHSMDSFMEKYNTAIDAKENTTNSDDIITIITAHSAKGTEYPVCYIAGANPMNYPSFYFTRGVPENIEEERRILYVALTRAKNELIITRSKNVNVYNEYSNSEMQNAENCYLFQNIPENLVQEYSHL